jgi:hypothetical protein
MLEMTLSGQQLEKENNSNKEVRLFSVHPVKPLDLWHTSKEHTPKYHPLDSEKEPQSDLR